MKRIYQKPEMEVIVSDATVQLLSGSPYDATPPNEVPDYDDWLE